jgi:hypothetical protein
LTLAQRLLWHGLAPHAAIVLVLRSHTEKGWVDVSKTIFTALSGSSLAALHAEAPLIGEILPFLPKSSFLAFCVRLLSFCLLGPLTFSFLLLLYDLAPVHAGIPTVTTLPQSAPAGPLPRTAFALNILFAQDSARISPKYYPELNKLGEALVRLPAAVEIAGHTDSSGSESESYNQRLTEKRAESVKQYLIEHFPINPERLIARGYGGSRPRASNDTESGRQQNRRIEIALPESNPPEELLASSEAQREEEADAAARLASRRPQKF